MTDQTALEIARLGFGTILNVSAIFIFAWYRVNKKFKLDKHKTIRAKLEAYWLEIIITVVVVPQWPETIKAAFELFIPK